MTWQIFWPQPWQIGKQCFYWSISTFLVQFILLTSWPFFGVKYTCKWETCHHNSCTEESYCTHFFQTEYNYWSNHIKRNFLLKKSTIEIIELSFSRTRFFAAKVNICIGNKIEFGYCSMTLLKNFNTYIEKQHFKLPNQIS